MNIRIVSMATLLFAATLAFGGTYDVPTIGTPISLTQDVAAICGDGGVGEPCNCPHAGLPGKDPLVPINC